MSAILSESRLGAKAGFSGSVGQSGLSVDRICGPLRNLGHAEVEGDRDKRMAMFVRHWHLVQIPDKVPSARRNARHGQLLRSNTSAYTTASDLSADDLMCQICLETLRQCVALIPCGHSFCASCTSHYLAANLQARPPAPAISGLASISLLAIKGRSWRPCQP